MVMGQTQSPISPRDCANSLLPQMLLIRTPLLLLGMACVRPDGIICGAELDPRISRYCRIDSFCFLTVLGTVFSRPAQKMDLYTVWMLVRTNQYLQWKLITKKYLVNFLFLPQTNARSHFCIQYKPGWGLVILYRHAWDKHVLAIVQCIRDDRRNRKSKIPCFYQRKGKQWLVGWYC